MEHRDASPWYLAQLKPNCARLAERNLARQGFTAFLPLERITRRQGRQLVATKRPYFPGYIFVRVECGSAPWRAIQSTQGIVRLVSFGSGPAPVPLEIISGLQMACDDEGCVAIEAELARGDEVRIAGGPFAGFMGEVDSLAPDKRAWVLLDVMGKATRTLIHFGDLKLAS